MVDIPERSTGSTLQAQANGGGQVPPFHVESWCVRDMYIMPVGMHDYSCANRVKFQSEHKCWGPWALGCRAESTQ